MAPCRLELGWSRNGACTFCAGVTSLDAHGSSRWSESGVYPGGTTSGEAGLDHCGPMETRGNRRIKKNELNNGNLWTYINREEPGKALELSAICSGSISNWSSCWRSSQPMDPSSDSVDDACGWRAGVAANAENERPTGHVIMGKLDGARRGSSAEGTSSKAARGLHTLCKPGLHYVSVNLESPCMRRVAGPHNTKAVAGVT